MAVKTAALIPQGALYEQAAAYKADLEAKVTPAVDAVLAAHADVYAQVREDYSDVLDKIAAAQAAGEPFTPAWLYQRTRLKTALANTKTEIAALSEFASEQAQQAQWAAVQASAKHAAKMGKTATQEQGLAASFLEVDPANLRHLVGFTSDGTPLDDLFRSFAPETDRLLREALVRGVALGRSVPWMTRHVQSALDLPRHRAETIIRTESMRVSRAVARDTYMANTEVLAGWTWTATLDARVCPACLVMDGTEHPVWATLDGHPRCRCAMVPRTKDWADLDADLADLPDTRPPVRSGKAWLEAQPPTTQRAILGPRKWAAWKAGEIDLDDVVARHSHPAWGTMRRERSMREIVDGEAANYPDEQPALPEPVEYAPDAAAVQSLAATFTADDLEGFLAEGGHQGQYEANLRAALAVVLNKGPDQGPSLPGPDEAAAAKMTAKMNAAVTTKGYPSKGYSQTVAIYKARANGQPGTKVGILDPLTWDAKMTAQKALEDHQVWLAEWLVQEQEKAALDAQAKATAVNLVGQVNGNLDNAADHQGVLDALLGGKGAAIILPEGPQKDRYLQWLDAKREAYEAQVADALDKRTQAPTWASAMDDAQVTITPDGWGLMTYQDTGSSQTLTPAQVNTILADSAYQPHLEPQPDVVAQMVGTMATSADPAYLDVQFVSWIETHLATHDYTADPDGLQTKANQQAALAQAKATLLPPAEQSSVTEIVDALKGDAATWEATYQSVANGTWPGASTQDQSNAKAGLAQWQEWKAQQVSLAPEPTDALPVLKVGRVATVVRQLANGTTDVDAVQGLVDDGILSPDDTYSLAVGLKMHQAGAPPWGTNWGKTPTQHLADNAAKIAKVKDDLASGALDDGTVLAYLNSPATTSSSKTLHAVRWLGLMEHYAEQGDLYGQKPQPVWGKHQQNVTALLAEWDSGQIDAWDLGIAASDPANSATQKADAAAAKAALDQFLQTMATGTIQDWYAQSQGFADHAAAKAAKKAPTPAVTASTPSPGPATPAGPVAAPGGPLGGGFGAPPDLSTLTDTGKVLGTHGARVFQAPDGTRWLHKPPANPADQFLVDVDVATARLQAASGLKAPDTYDVVLGGKRGSLQRMFDSQDAFPSFQPGALSAADLLEVQKQHVLDWLLSNHDGHQAQFLRLPSGELVGIDKGQAFRWMGQDVLDWGFHPNANYGAPPPVYNALWRGFANGQAVDVLDPRTGALADYIGVLEAMPDDAIRDLFRSYAEGAAARGLLAVPQPSFPGVKVPPGGLPTNDVDAFLDLIVARKNGLAKDFTALFDRAATEREKNLPGYVKPSRPKPTPSQRKAAKAKSLVGSPEPTKPVAPQPVDEVGTDLFTSWLAKAEARYQASPIPVHKASLKDTNNWTRFERVISLGDKSAVDELESRQYLDAALAQEARDLIDQAAALKAQAQADFDQRQAAYTDALTRYTKDLAEWREANGIVITVEGVDGALRHAKDVDGVTWGNQVFDAAKWTAAQRSALKTYTGGTYSEWNGHLRRTKGDPGPYKATLDKVDAAMPVQPIPEDVILHRGTGVESFQDATGKYLTYSDSHRLTELVGTVQRDHAYVSSSVGNSAAFDSYPAQIKFRVPAGYPAAYVKAFSNFSNEREVILSRDVTYYVHAVYKIGSQWCIEAEIIPKDQAEDWRPPLDTHGAPIVTPSATPWTTLKRDYTA